MPNKTTIKISNERVTFLNKIKKNLVKMDYDPAFKFTYDDIILGIEKYFKMYNDSYLKMLEEMQKNV